MSQVNVNPPSQYDDDRGGRWLVPALLALLALAVVAWLMFSNGFGRGDAVTTTNSPAIATTVPGQVGGNRTTAPAPGVSGGTGVGTTGGTGTTAGGTTTGGTTTGGAGTTTGGTGTTGAGTNTGTPGTTTRP